MLYERVLVPLGSRFFTEDGQAVGFGNAAWQFGIVATSAPIPKLHVAFRARSRSAVDAFFIEALAAGAKSNGPPGLRQRYDPQYYAAFVLDPDGHNVETVFRGKPELADAHG
jgi:catechol 2,3-dioxygenase-like lactoylglutathione lyase family enzyme